MKKRVYRRSHSQIINNFYTLVTIVIMTAVIALYSKYIHQDKEKLQEITLLPCLNELKIEQKVAKDEFLKEAWQLFEQGNYGVDGGLIVEENFILPLDFSLEKTNEIFENSIDIVAIKNAQKFLKIKYEIMQTKNKEPIELGFLVSFRVNAKEVMRMKTLFNTTKHKEFSSKIVCIMESFKANAKQ